MAERPDIVQLLAEHELVLKRLYGVFAELFPQHAVLWESIAAQEQDHADALLHMRSEHPDESVAAFERFKPQAVLSSIAFVEDKVAEARAGKMDAQAALALGRELESALLEDAFFKVRESAPAALAPTFSLLAAQTRQHRDLLSDALIVQRGV